MKNKIKVGERRLFRTKPRGGYISGTVVAIHDAGDVTMKIGGRGPLSGNWHIGGTLIGPALVAPRARAKGRCAMCNKPLGGKWRCGNCEFVN